MAWLSVFETSKVIGIAPISVRQLNKNGFLKKRKELNGEYFFDKNEVESIKEKLDKSLQFLK